MVLADPHPSCADVEAFALGNLDDGALAAVGAHITGCPACQECAAAASGDLFVELLRRAHARMVPQTDPLSRDVGPAQTPAPAAAWTVTMSPAPASDVPRPEPGAVAPADLSHHERYRVVRLLGEGGMGSVYEAEHRVLERAVALKVIHRAYTANPAAVERFRREVRAAALLSHPNIVTTHDAEDAGGTLFLVMEYVEGVSLDRLVREGGPLPVAEACAYVRQAGQGLQHAHERGMVHRDVKPDNLIRCADGTVKVLDFGLAALTAERGGGLTDTNVLMSTPDFMAPEQAEDPRTADGRADVYSLGCTLYYLLAGSVPFPAETSLQKILAHREKPVPSLRQVRPEVPPALARVMTRLLAKKPEDRYQTPGEVAAALEPFTCGGAGPSRKAPWLLATAALAMLCGGLLLAGGVVYRIQTDTGELVITTESPDVEVLVKQGGREVRLLDTKMDKQITLALRSGVYELELKGAPAGLKLSIDKATLTRGETVLAKIEKSAQVPEGKAEEVFRQRWDTCPVTWGVDLSPDGRLLLSMHWGGVRVWEVASGKVAWESPNGDVLGDFTPDGQQFMTVSPPDGAGDCLRLYDTASGKLLRKFGKHERVCRSLVMGPDGRTVWTVGDDWITRLWNVETGEMLHSWPHGTSNSLYSRDGRQLFVYPPGEDLWRVWDIRAGKEVGAFEKLRLAGVRPSYFLPGGREVMASPGRGPDFPIYEVSRGQLLRKVRVRAAAQIDCWDVTHQGRCSRLPVCLPDGTVCVLDLLSGQEVARLGARNFQPRCMATSADGRFVAACASNQVGDVVVWRLPNPPADDR
jgi:WD40 repeat protein/tRNA A-37 threonylcarbamoyl transferase component Bud32